MTTPADIAAAVLAEREACALTCERASLASKRDGYGTESAAEQGCADAIRSRPAPDAEALERALSEAYAQGVIDGQAAIAAGKAVIGGGA